MKKKYAVSVLSVFALTLGLMTLMSNVNFNKLKTFGNAYDEINCDYYFDPNNGYTSIYEIVENLNYGDTTSSYKTWGTVTRVFSGSSYSNPYPNFYIQSTDKYHNVAGVLIYNCPVSVSIGNVITISGTPILYNNLPEFLNPSSGDITIDFLTNKSPVQPFETPSSFWQNGTDFNSSEFLNAASMGTRLVTIKNVNLYFVGYGNNNYALFDNDATMVPFYYPLLTNTNEIHDRIYACQYELTHKSYNVTGVLQSFINASQTSASLQLLIRDVNDIVESTSGGEGGELDDYSLTIDSSNFSSSNSYNTGNYGATSVSSYAFEYYRTVKSYDGSFITLLPYLETYGEGTEPGAIYNTSPIVGINEIKITYKTASNSGIAPSLLYGLNGFEETYDLPLSNFDKTETIAVGSANYFKIQTSQITVSIISIEVSYSNSSSSATSFTYSKSGSGDYRLNPMSFSGSLYEGVSVVVPWKITRTGNTYTINKTKTFRYYSFSYIYANPSLVNLASYTDPLEVAAFYTIFKTKPANYVSSSEYWDAYDIFGDNTRCVSWYERTDGYATAIPYKAYGSKPSYYEFDIATSSSYSSNNRGVGRVVAWEYGFDPLKGATGYDSSPVSIYTDDHYFTFQEYMNDGTFGQRFNGTNKYTSYIWGVSTTLSSS